MSSACVAGSGDEGFAIVHNLTPGENCSITPGGPFLGRGLIEKQSPSPYILTPEIISYITSSDGTEQQRTISLRGARVEVFELSGSTKTSRAKFTSLFAGNLLPGSTTTAAFDVLPLDVIASSAASGNTRVQYVARITPYGAVGGGGEVDGVPFEYPVTVCDGCIRQVVGACPLAFGTVVVDNSNSCNQAQDGNVMCCMGTTGLVCPAIVAAQPPPA